MKPEPKLDHSPDDFATSDDVRLAIEAFTKEDSYRLRKAAAYCLAGTEYQDINEIINEGVLRTIRATVGEKGRRWPKNIPFVAYMIQTIKGLADDSRQSSMQTKTVSIEAMATESVGAEDALGELKYCHQDVETQAIELEDIQERADRAKMDADKIETFFKNDSEINWIMEGHKDGMTAAEIREIAEMSLTQYETARRRFRRGLEKLFPGRRAS